MSVARKLFWFTATMLLNLMSLQEGISESSEEYLNKVMIELQELNSPSTSDFVQYDTLSSNIENYKNSIYESNNIQDHRITDVAHRVNDNAAKIIQKYQTQVHQPYGILPNDKIDLDHTNFQLLPQKYQVQTPIVTKVQRPELVGFTKAELAALYKNALEKGSAISLSSLTNALASGEKPHVTGTHLEIPAAKPMYQYYFFPLKSFMSEFQKDHGYKTIPASTLENTEAEETSQTHVANPLFVAISTFISMALLFMMGVLFLPKLQQYGVIHARDIRDDLLHLSDIVMNAVDRYSLSQKFAERRLDSGR